MPRITKRLVEGLRAEGGELFVWDDALPCFGVRVKPSGGRSYLVQYRNEHGRTRRVTLGRHGVLTAEQARDMARGVLADVRKGADPSAERRDRRKAPSVAELAARFLAEHVEAKGKPNTAREYRRLFDRLILPSLGRYSVEAVTRAEVARLHHALRGTPYQANRVLAVLSKLFNWAERHGYRPDGSNPCRHVEKFKEHKRERFLSPEELPRLGVALAEAERRRTVLPGIPAAIRLLVLTGARLTEILTLRWSEVDLGRACLRLADSKTGAKTIHLNPPALELLATLPRADGNPYVIPGERPGRHLVNLEKPWRAIRARAGLDDVRLHDLRHSFASVGAAAGYGLPIIGALLGHTQAATTARYAHLAADPLRAANDIIGRRLAAAMAAPAGCPDQAGVVTLRPEPRARKRRG